jgi:hypothetical protein
MQRRAAEPTMTRCVVPAAGVALCALLGCVPPGTAEPQDAGAAPKPTVNRALPSASASAAPPSDLLRRPFEDDFEHGIQAVLANPLIWGEGGGEVDGSQTVVEPRPQDWMATAPGIWHIESGRLCGEHAHNHGIWLRHAIPTNARIEFDAVSQSADGDLKAEFWGDGRSAATALSYTNATSYLTIFGGWHNKLHVLARINEHGGDRKEITVDPNSDDPREKPVMVGQLYHFKVERSDGRSLRWWVDGNEMFTFADTAPLTGPGHDHFGFNDWDAKVCFDNVRVVPLP